MEKKKKFLWAMLLAELVLPWLVLVSGRLAMFCWVHEYSKMLEIFYNTSMITGIVAMILEFIIGIVSFVLFIALIFNKKTDNTESIIIGAISWIISGFCILGTFINMTLVMTFTYGQSV